MVKDKIKEEKKVAAKKTKEEKPKKAAASKPSVAKAKPAVKPKAAAEGKPAKKAVSLKKKTLTKKEKLAAFLAEEKPVAAKPAVAPVQHEVPKPVVAVKPDVAPKPAPAPVVSTPHKEEAKKEIKPEAAKPAPAEVKVEAAELKPAVDLKDLELEIPISVKDLAIKLQEKPSVLIKMLMDMRIMVGINQNLDETIVSKICEKYGCKVKKAAGREEVALRTHEEEDDPKKLKPRAPVVTIMGHVDHGKTSLLDAIRKTKVAESEFGGITQHIGAYRVTLGHGEITFLDTPGHEAFTAMRARGASVTDIVILVVAADDGLMPQTQEAVDHARAAGVPIIVAINKIDKPQADLDRVKKQLQKIDLAPEDWGGKTIMVPVSAKTGEGIDNLLEMMLLEAQMLELKANPDRRAKGVVVEAKMSKGRGPVATLLVQNGTLRLNDNVIVGNIYGKIKAMFNDHGVSATTAGPGVPVEVLGITGIPAAGEQFFVIAEEKEAKQIVSLRQEQERLQQIRTVKKISLEDLHAQIEEGKIKELKMIIKADVQGSLEAIKDVLAKINVSEIKLVIIHEGIGLINNSDAILAAASNALILGFNVNADDLGKETASREGVEIRTYNIIYELVNDIRAAVEGMLAPKLKRVFLGRADVRKVFKLSKSGIVAGCYVTKGKINRNAQVTLIRNGEPVYEGKISALKRFKDDVRDVAEGFECGISIGGFDQYMEGDVIEAFEIEKIARKL
jgi:translation initiation factor IF-2